MGGSQSSRKLTIDNENAIQVSQDALDRIQVQLTRKVPELQQLPSDYAEYSPPHPEYDEKKWKQNAEEEAYWARRIEELKKAHETISQKMVQEYQKTLKETDELFYSTAERVRPLDLPCREQKERVIQCYNANPHQTLVCSGVVKEFNDCVSKCRMSALSAS